MFLKNNWIYVAIGVVVLALLAYVGVLKWEVSHYKGEVAELQAKLDVLKAKEVQLAQDNKRITEAHAETLKRYKDEILKNVQTNKEKIEANEELKRTRISLAAVRVLIDAQRDPESKDPPPPVKGDDGGTGTDQGIPLASIFAVVNENDANHRVCIKQVLEWQKFWREYSTAVGQVNPE